MMIKEDTDLKQFQYNATVPHSEHFKKRNKVDVAKEKIVDRVKKMKKQAPQVDNLNGDNPAQLAHFRLAENESNEQPCLEQSQQVSKLKFIYSRNNYSEMVQQSKFFSKIKEYHQDYYHGPLLSFSSISNSEEEEEDEEESEITLMNDVQQQKIRFLKRRKNIISKHDQDSSSMSSNSFKNSTSKMNERRRKLISSISNQHNKIRYRKRRVQLQLVVNEQQQETQEERMNIRHRMMNFVIPADWTCITGSKDNSTKSRDILSHEFLMDQLAKNIQAQQLSIEHFMEKINESRITIHEYKQKILKLNQKLNRLSLSTSDSCKFDGEDDDHSNINKRKTRTKSSLIETVIFNNHHYSSSPLSKSSYLLKQAYRHHRKLVRKIEKYRTKMNFSTRLEYLQVKVQQSLEEQTSLLQCWNFPVGVLLIITLSFFILF